MTVGMGLSPVALPISPAPGPQTPQTPLLHVIPSRALARGLLAPEGRRPRAWH